MAFMPFSLSSPARSACVHALLQWRLKGPAVGVRACGLHLTGRWLQSERGGRAHEAVGRAASARRASAARPRAATDAGHELNVELINAPMARPIRISP